jgi:hypothetical protein
MYLLDGRAERNSSPTIGEHAAEPGSTMLQAELR